MGRWHFPCTTLIPLLDSSAAAATPTPRVNVIIRPCPCFFLVSVAAISAIYPKKGEIFVASWGTLTFFRVCATGMDLMPQFHWNIQPFMELVWRLPKNFLFPLFLVWLIKRKTFSAALLLGKCYSIWPRITDSPLLFTLNTEATILRAREQLNATGQYYPLFYSCSILKPLIR
jgi:hypothetical protein